MGKTSNAVSPFVLWASTPSIFSCRIKGTVSEEGYKGYKFKNKKKMKTNLEMPRTDEYRAQEQMGIALEASRDQEKPKGGERSSSGSETQH